MSLTTGSINAIIPSFAVPRQAVSKPSPPGAGEPDAGTVALSPGSPPDSLASNQLNRSQNATGNATERIYLERPPRLAYVIPGLNLLAGGLEACNAVVSARKGDRLEAAGHAANALCCLGDFGEDMARWASFSHLSGPLQTTSLVLGVAGGTLATVSGIQEIRQGLRLHQQRGLSAMLHIGIADTISGTSPLVGLGLTASQVAPGAGTALLATASLCDVISIAVDHYSRQQDAKRHPELDRSSGSHRATPHPPEPQTPTASGL
jgi:hypothetical protein